MEKYLVGIDFGACNLKAARWLSNKRIPLRPLKLNKIETGNYETPNVILYDKTKAGAVEKIVGHIAKISDDYQNRVDYVKRKLELKDWAQSIGNLGRSVTAVEAATDIFAWVKAAIEENKSGAEEIHAAITMPVCFSEMQKRRMFEALRAAKIPVQNVITEPFAALFSVEEFFDDDEDKVVLIFDFGGSTLDLSLIRLENSGGRLIVEELASVGKRYGGVDIDRAIYTEILAKKYPAEIAAIKAADDSAGKVATENELVACACKLKEWLFSAADEVSVKDTGTPFHGGTEVYRFELTLAEVEELFARQKIREQIIEMLDELFDQAEDVEKAEVTHVKAFGGTSHIRIFLELLEEYFGAEIFDSAEYFEEAIADNDEFYLSAAAGAARYLALCEENPDKVEIRSKIPFSIGVARGNKFVKYLDCNPPYGVATKNILLSWAELAKNNNRLALYQSFADSSNVAIEGDGGAVYLGSVPVQRDLYESAEHIGLTMKMLSAGNLRLSFRETRGDKIVVVEEKNFRIGEETNGRAEGTA